MRVEETASGCRLTLAGLTHGNGSALQDAADDLVARLLTMVLCVLHSGLRAPAGLGPPDHRVLTFLWELGEIARRGGDIRDRIFSVENVRVAAPGW